MRFLQFLIPPPKRFFFLLLFFLPLFFLSAQTKKTVKAVRVTTAPQIDGAIDDAVWDNAIPIRNFLQQEPVAGAIPSLQTEAKIIYDDEYLYIGVICYDDEPDKIIARELKWDGFISADDNVKIIFDTFNDNRSAYWFGTNPLGSQDDALLTGFEMNGFNEAWNGIWEVECKILNNGWSAEFRFPFSTFKFYNQEKQIWGFNIERGIRRKNETVLWTSSGQNSGLMKISESGDLTGIEKIQRGNPIYLKPYFTAGAQFINGDKKYIYEPGLDVKYGVTETLSLDVTVNTDFAQVESDRARINLSRFPLFFPEKREFFLEGMRTFDFNLGGSDNLFYSRRIGIGSGKQIPIIAGAKLVGRVGNFEIGAINMQTAPKDEEPTTNYSVARAKYDLFGSSSIGILFTNKLSGKGYNSAIGTDMNFEFNNFLGDKNLIIHAGVAKTEEKEGAKNSWAGNFFVDYPNDLIDTYLGYRFIQGGFNPSMGFVSRKSFQQLTYDLQIAPRINQFGIKKLAFELLESSLYFDDSGILQSAQFTFSPLEIETESGDQFGISVHRTFDKPVEPFEIFNGTQIPAGDYWYTTHGVFIDTSPSRSVFAEVEYSWGGYYNGSRKSFASEISLIANQHLTVSGDYSFNQININNKSLNTHEIGSRLTYSFSTKVASSIFTQWNNEDNEVNINFRINWKPKVGSDFYLVINHLLSTENRLRSKDFAILAKFVWMIII
ncbi:MAG: DUF5916 domain-containing protein [Melioribacteraceae bacterium]